MTARKIRRIFVVRKGDKRNAPIGEKSITNKTHEVMKIYKETNLTDFEFWSGAQDFAAQLTSTELEQVEAILEDLYPDGIDETALNDLFWFDRETVAEWIGTTENEIWAR